MSSLRISRAAFRESDLILHSKMNKIFSVSHSMFSRQLKLLKKRLINYELRVSRDVDGQTRSSPSKADQAADYALQTVQQIA